MNMSTIDFSFFLKRDNTVEAALVIDGKVIPYQFFDPFELLGARKVLAAELYPFTCDCGEPGDAGYDPMIVRQRDGVVSWFPQYRCIEHMGAQEIHFEEKAYQAALDRLLAGIASHTAEGAQFVLLREVAFDENGNQVEDTYLNYAETISHLAAGFQREEQQVVSDNPEIFKAAA